MAEFIHSTKAEIDGPFLIDRSQLEALDKILEEEWLRFREERKARLDQAVEQDFKKERSKSYYKEESDEHIRKRIRNEFDNSHAFRERKEFFLFLKNGSSAKVLDFAAAHREPDLHDKEPNGLYAILQSGEHSCEVTITNRRPSLTVEVSPKRDQFVQQTLMVLKNWQNSVRPPKWQSIWVKLVRGSPVHWVVWFFAVAMSFLSIEQNAETIQARQFHQEAMQLVTNNISGENQGKAIRLLLAKTYGFAPKPIKREFPSWFFVILFGGLAYCFGLSYTPDVSIAIGQGEGKVRFWRRYSKFILITTPMFIFGTFLWPKIEPILKSLL